MRQDWALTEFWELLETNFPLALPRRCLSERFGTELVALLERAGLLSFMGVAETYPCPHPGGASCPRRVVHLPGGRIEAVCGNDPPECEDIKLTAQDIEILGIQPEKLCEAIREALQLGGRAEKLADLPQVYRTGTYSLSPTSRCNVYLVVQSGPQEYAMAFHALRSRGDGERLSILIPTDRFVSEDDIQTMGHAGAPVVCLGHVIDVGASGRLCSVVPAEEVLATAATIGISALPAKASFAAAAANLDENALYTYARLAELFGLPEEALRKRLERYRQTNLDHGWEEIANRRANEPKYRYELRAVKHIIEDMLASSERPAE